MSWPLPNMFHGQYFHHRGNLHNMGARGAHAQLQHPTGSAQSTAVVPARCAALQAAHCPMSMPMLPVDMGIDIASVRAEIDNCKRRYQRDVWNVLFCKALQRDGPAATGEGRWKKPDGDHRHEDSAASATSGDRVAQQAPGQANATSTGAASTEDHQPPAGTEPEAKSDEEEGTTEDVVNENNMMHRRRLAARRRSVSNTDRCQESQSRPGGSGSSRGCGIGNSSSCGGEWKDDWHNYNNSTYNQRRAAVGQPQYRPERQPSRPPPWRRDPDVVTTQLRRLSERRVMNREHNGGDCDDSSSSSDDVDAAELVDNYSFGTSDSSGCDEFRFGRRFVPIFCGDWSAAVLWRRQRRSWERRRGGLSVTYHEPMPTPASEQRTARF